MIESILVLVSPFVVRYATSIIKQVPLIAAANGWRIPMVRAVVAILSLVAAVLTQAIGEGTVEPGMVETTVLTVINGAVATGLYLWAKRRSQ